MHPKHQTPITTITTQTPITESPNIRHPFDLEERTLAFAKAVLRYCRALKADTVNRELIGQVIRASGSIGANYREANDALSKKDFAHRIRIVRREAKEAEYWLQLLAECDGGSAGEMAKLLREVVELKKIFSSIVGKAA